MKHPLFDPLRGLAALWVVAYHLQAGSPAVQNLPFVSALAGAGFLGVPMFFVISGFCLAAAARRALDEAKPASDFLSRRLWRIFPPFWYSALFAAVLSPVSFAPDVEGWLCMLSLGQIFNPANERVLDRFKELNSPYWSLAIEVQFYAVVALALCLRSRFFAVLAAATALSLCAYAFPAILTSGAFLPFWPPFAMGADPARDPAPGLDAGAARRDSSRPVDHRPAWPHPGRHPGRRLGLRLPSQRRKPGAAQCRRLRHPVHGAAVAGLRLGLLRPRSRLARPPRAAARGHVPTPST